MLSINFRSITFVGLTLFTALTLRVQAQEATPEEEAIHFQQELNQHYADSSKSPLEAEDLKHFHGLEFFPVNLEYRVHAQFIRTPNQEPFEMMTTTDRKPVYEKYAEIHFQLKGVECRLNVYQSHDLRNSEEHADHLFLPFKDFTNGSETYGGGRYIDLSIPEGDMIIIDFNQAYNPYCAYSYRYSCPLVPEENQLPLAVLAGVKNWGH